MPFTWNEGFSLNVHLSQVLITSGGDGLFGQLSVQLTDIRVFDAGGSPVDGRDAPRPD